MDRENVTCADTGQPVAELDLNMCKTYSLYSLILIISLLSVVVLSIVLLLWYKMRLRIFSKFFIFRNGDERAHKMYDAFISYAHQDENYVANLVRKLEARKNPYKLCLHSRDWVPGEFIVKQMANSVNTSHASIIVLSSAYFRSKWCYSEFRIALTQMLVRRNHKVIAIWLSDEDPSKGKLDPDIRLYISACTFLKYDDAMFLNKLETALSGKN